MTLAKNYISIDVQSTGAGFIYALFAIEAKHPVIYATVNVMTS